MTHRASSNGNDCSSSLALSRTTSTDCHHSSLWLFVMLFALFIKELHLLQKEMWQFHLDVNDSTPPDPEASITWPLFIQEMRCSHIWHSLCIKEIPSRQKSSQPCNINAIPYCLTRLRSDPTYAHTHIQDCWSRHRGPQGGPCVTRRWPTFIPRCLGGAGLDLAAVSRRIQCSMLFLLTILNIWQVQGLSRALDVRPV